MDLIIDNYIIDTPIIEIIDQLKKELNNSKLKIVQQKGDDIRVTCPSHKDGYESHPSCGIYCGNSPDIEYGTTHCFTCGFGGPLYHFVAECFERSDEFGKQWLIERFGELYEDRTLNLESIELDNHSDEVECLDESILETMQSFHPYMSKRNLSREICEKFKVKYESKTHSIVFPVWDEHDNFIMCTRRSVDNKTFIIDANKEKPVYLYNYIKNNNIHEVTVVESQINCLTLWGWNWPSVALFGTGTRHQYDVLNKSNIQHYYLALDGDSAGDKGIKRFLDNIRDDVFVDIILIPRGKDVNDLTFEEFNKLQIISKEKWLYEHQ